MINDWKNHSYNSSKSRVAMLLEKNWGKLFIEMIMYLKSGGKGSTGFLKLNVKK